MTLALPEWPDLFKKFKCHKTGKGLGTIAVECCCLFCVGFRAPIAYAFGQANLSDHKLIRKLIKFLKKGDLLLIDGGFYSFRLFKALAPICPFIIPMDKSGNPRVIKMILACMIRLAMTEAAKAKGLLPGALSFCRALIETRIFLKKLISQICKMDWCSVYRRYIKQFGQYLIKVKPGCFFPRDKQVYRKKGRGLLRKPVGRPRTVLPPSLPPEEESITNQKGISYFLS